MSRPITVSIPHSLGKAEARRRIEQGFGDVAERLSAAGGGARMAAMRQSWNGDVLNFSLSAMGQAITGTLEAEEREVRISVELPAFLAGFADALSGVLKREGRLLLDDKNKKK
jgi:hypothetical protein